MNVEINSNKIDFIKNILNKHNDLENPINLVYCINNLINKLEHNKYNISLNCFMVLLKDNIYKHIKFTYYTDFILNVVKNSYNPYHSKSYDTYRNYYLYFLNYGYYYFSRLYKNQNLSPNKKINSYDNSRNIKKQIDFYIEILDKDADNIIL